MKGSMRLRLVILAIVTLVGCGSVGEDETNEVQPDLDDIALSSAVSIRSIGCAPGSIRGAGAVIEGGFVLTAGHVVAGATSIMVQPANNPPGSEPRAAHLVALDPKNDLALLAITGTSVPALRVARGASTGAGLTTVFRESKAVLHPFVITRPVQVRILDIYGQRTVTRESYQVAAETSGGDSGAVLIGPEGTAVGVLYAQSDVSDDRAWATTMAAVPRLIDDARLVDPSSGIDTGACAPD
jgi:S1-C subfamily serine protease